MGVLRGLAVLALAAALSPAAPAAITPASVNDANRLGPLGKGAEGSLVFRAQVMLDRAWFSPGEIDARFGVTMAKAVAAFQRGRGLPATGRIDKATWAELSEGIDTVLVEHTVAAQDVPGPFEPIPADMMERAKLKHLGYESPVEAIAEKFHVSQRLLRAVNPGKRFEAGESILVPLVADATHPPARAASLVLEKKQRVLKALDAQGAVIAQFPISVGSKRDELPVGRLKITTEVRDPSFDYDPALLHDARPGYTKVQIAPGPNNPVGVMWLGLSKPHYGIHGTPDPSTIGKRETNGCIHLANWDALKVAALVAPGTPVDVRP